MNRTLAYRIAVVASVCPLFAACVPNRDNPADPQNAPTAALTIVDVPRDASGLCPSPSTAGAAVQHASRGDCLVLDAHGSSTPGGTLTYTFAYLGTSGTMSTTQSTAYLMIDGSLLRQQVVGVPVTFGVTVDNGEGGSSLATASIVLDDARPSASIDAPRALPIAGYPWDPTTRTSIPVTFSGTGSSDPDQDPPSYCWTFRGLGLEGYDKCTNAKSITVPVPVTARGSAIVSLVVSDNTLTSLPVTTTVSVGDRQVWRQDQSLLQRMDSVAAPFPQYASGNHTPNVAFFGNAGSASRMAIMDGTTLSLTTRTISTAPFPAAAPTSTPVLIANGMGYATLAADGARNRVWVAADAYPTNLLQAVKSYVMQPNGSLTPEITTAGWDRSGSFETWMQVDATGALWTSHNDATIPVAVVSTDGTLSNIPFVGVGNRRITGVGARPDDDEVWVVESPTATDGPADHALLLRYAVPGNVLLQKIDTGVDLVYGVAWIDDSEFWTFLPDEGLVRVDATRLAAGEPLSQAIEIALPDVLYATFMYPSPDGSVYVTGGALVSEGAYAVSYGGDVFPIPYPAPSPHGVDPEGGVWYSDISYYGLNRAETLASSGVVQQTQIVAAGGGGEVYADGGFWVARGTSETDPILFRRASDGSPIRSITRWRNAGSSDLGAPFEPIQMFTVNPDGNQGWMITIDPQVGIAPLKWLDLRGDVAESKTVLDAADTADILGYAAMLVPAPPGFASEVWTGISPQTGLRFVTIDTAGTITTQFAPPAGEVQTDAAGDALESQPTLAVLPDTNQACLVTIDTSIVPNVAHLRRIFPDGNGATATQLTTVNLSTSFPVAQAGASWDPTYGDVCWIYYQSSFASCPTPGSSTIEAWRVSNGTKIRSYTFNQSSFALSGFFPESANRVWINFPAPCPAAGAPTTTTQRLDYTTGTTMTPTSFSTVDGTYLLSP